MDWAEKYRPSHITDLVGNREEIKKMVEWAQEWTPSSKPLLLYGKPGIGKTSSAYALARDMGWEVVELNASDQRTKDVIERVAGAGSTTRSLSGAEQKLIILDEADNLHGNADRGGARAISMILKHAMQPIILIANDLYGITPDIQRLSQKIQFKAIQARSIAPKLKEICAREGIRSSDEAITILAQKAQGDVRSAINMLYASCIGQNHLTRDDLNISQKDHRSSIFDLISAVYGMKGKQDLLLMTLEVDETPDRILPWIEEQIPNLPTQEHQAQSYYWLTHADRYLGRTFRMQYYTLWRYASAVMIFCIAPSISGKNMAFRIMPPHRRNRIATARKQQQSRQGIISHLGWRLHISQAHIQEEYNRSISLIATAHPREFTRTYSCDADQLEYITGDQALAHTITKEIEAEEKNRLKEEKNKDTEKKTPKKVEAEKPESATVQTREREEPQEPKRTQNQSTLFSFGG